MSPRMPAQMAANPIMFVLGGVILVSVIGWMLFQAADGLALEPEPAPARVVSKGYRAAGRSYVTQVINNRPVVVPHVTPEAWLLGLELAGEQVDAATSQDVYDRVTPGDQVLVSYVRRRLTGTLVVVEVRPPAGVTR